MTQPGTISCAQLARLSGLTERRLRELAAEGWFSKPVTGHYHLVDTIRGLLRFYREREQSRIVQDSYDSIGSCAAATGIPVTAIKHAKRQGCSAFRGSRVYLAALLRWLFSAGDQCLVNYDQERANNLVLQNTKLQAEIRRSNRELISVSEVEAAGAKLGLAVRHVITRLHQRASSLTGHPTEVIEKQLMEVEDEIIEQLHGLEVQLSEWREEAKQAKEASGSEAGEPSMRLTG